MGYWQCSMEAMERMKNIFSTNFWNKKRVLITGNTGFKGSWLTLWLSELGAHVTGIGLKPNTTPSLYRQIDIKQRIERQHIADIRDANIIKSIVHECQPEIVIHLAAQPLVKESYRDPLGTWSTNVQGCLNLLEALKHLNHKCSVVMVTTDKVYQNKEWDFGYREDDELGGHDPYSASKAAAEIAIASWRKSFCGHDAHQTKNLAIATARAGNVIGGGDWAENRIIPDAIRALAASRPIGVRNPRATRPWQHVLEPLGGYLCLAKALADNQNDEHKSNLYCSSFNFGPSLEANQTVGELIDATLKYWPGKWVDTSETKGLHEAGRLHLQIDKAVHQLGWMPQWKFARTVARTVDWYRSVDAGEDATQCCLKDIYLYQNSVQTSNE